MTGQKWTFTIMARVLLNDQYVFRLGIGAILEILPMYLPLAVKLKLKNDNCVLNGVENILYTIYVHYDYIHLLYMYSTVITIVSHCCFAASPQY